MSRAEAALTLQSFLATYNKAEKAYDADLIATVTAGPYGDRRKASLRGSRAQKPGGKPDYQPLVLSDTKFVIPKKAGWPRWFLADADSNRDEGTAKADRRVALVFNKESADRPWKVTYVLNIPAGQMPVFKTDREGWAEPVAPEDTGLSIPVGELSERYARYLGDGVPNGFAPGTHTTGRRAVRARDAYRPGYTTQWLDQESVAGAYGPVALRTADGGALAFFATRQFEQMKLDGSAKKPKLPVTANIKAIMTGTATDTLIREMVSTEAVTVPTAATAGARVQFLSRSHGLISARGE